MAEHDEKWAGLLRNVRDLGVWSLAYSGGLDSRLLAHAGLAAENPPQLLHVAGPHVADGDTAYALAWARLRGLQIEVLEADPLLLPLVAAGDRERCYACKRHVFELLGVRARGVLCDGSNTSDALVYRPGRRALHELGIRSPLEEAGLSKSEVRLLAVATGLERPAQQARACLLTRLPYGLPPTPAVLCWLERGESLVEQWLADQGQPELPFRLRLVEEDRVELHLPRGAVATDVLQPLQVLLREAGVASVTACLVDSLSGYFDASVTVRETRQNGERGCDPQALGTPRNNGTSNA